jgi:cell volume regulation protein A
MAYILTISLTYLLAHGDASIPMLIFQFVKQMVIGAIAGYAIGKGIVFIINKIKLETEGIYPVLIMATILFTYSSVHIIGGNGFLAVYLSAIVLGSNNFIHKKSIIRFYDGQAWLMQIVMFLTMGLLVFPSQIWPIIDTGLLVSAVLIFLARPIAVFISLSFFKMRIRDKLFISWVGLRGAVPMVFATYPMIAGIPKADIIFPLVFFISVTSVLFQGSTLHLVADWLKVTVPQKAKKITPLDMELYDTVSSELVEAILPGDSKAVGKAIVNIRLPKQALIVLIVRDSKYIQPSGSTVLEEGDKLLLLANNKDILNEMYKTLGL